MCSLLAIGEVSDYVKTISKNPMNVNLTRMRQVTTKVANYAKLLMENPVGRGPSKYYRYYYWEDWKRWAPTTEDTGHLNLETGFMLACYRRGIGCPVNQKPYNESCLVFGRRELQKMINTIRDVVWMENKSQFKYRLDKDMNHNTCKGYRRGYCLSFHNTVELSQIDPTIFDIFLKNYIARKKIVGDHKSSIPSMYIASNPELLNKIV